MTINLTQWLSLITLLSVAISFGTDVFFALIGKDALKQSSDASMTEVMGYFHKVADARMPVFGAVSILGCIALGVMSGLGSAASFLALTSLVALLLHLALYFRVHLKSHKDALGLNKLEGWT
jgi:hypothetical protein